MTLSEQVDTILKGCGEVIDYDMESNTEIEEYVCSSFNLCPKCLATAKGLLLGLDDELETLNRFYNNGENGFVYDFNDTLKEKIEEITLTQKRLREVLK